MSLPPVDAAQIGHAAGLLQSGGIVAFPTETVYGLGADADNVAAVGRIFQAKGRPADHPVIVHVADAQAAAAWAARISASAQTLMQRFWPGPLTLVLPRSARAHDALTGGQASVGLRCPAHPWARALIQALAQRTGDACRAIAAPSANRFGHLSATRAGHVRADLGQAPAGPVDLILDGGACPLGIESTIVDLTADAPRLLRPGSISRAAIEQALGAPLASIAIGDATAPRAPGRLLKHYAPRKPLELVEAGELGARVRMLGATRVAVLARAATLAAGAVPHGLRWVAAEDPQTYARHLYEYLHAMDASPAHWLLVERLPAHEDWAALQDRLARSAATLPGRYDDAD